MAVRRKIGRKESTNFTRAMQPALLMNFPFHGCRCEAALLMYGCKSTLHNLPRESESLRYLMGSWDVAAAAKSASRSSSSHLIGEMLLLVMFVAKPET